MPLNSYVSLNASAYEENDDTSVIEVLETNFVEDPLDTITKKEYYSGNIKNVPWIKCCTCFVIDEKGQKVLYKIYSSNNYD